MKTLKETSNWLQGGGIISCLTANFNVPWKNVITGQTLDDDYYGNRSGSKLISPFTEMLLDDQTKKLDATATNRLATIIFSKYGGNWDKAYEALTIDYNPIHNYDGEESYTETRAVNETIDRDVADGYTKTNTGTQSDSGSNIKSGSIDNTKETYDKAAYPTSGTAKGTETTIIDRFGKNGNTTDERKTITKERGQKEDKLDYTNRQNQKTIGGTITDTHTPTDYTRTVKESSKEYSQHRINAFNDGLVIADDNETLQGVGNGAGGAGGTPSISGGNFNERTEIESGSYSDSRGYTNYTETDAPSGSETHTVKVTGIGDNENYKTEVEEQGSNTHTEEKIDYSKPYEDATETYNDVTDTTSNTRTDNLSEVNSGTTAEDISKATAETITHELERGGNYGMTTTQKMITEELELRKLYNLFDSIVFPDIDKVMVLNNFEPNGVLY